jgi:adenylate kinase
MAKISKTQLIKLQKKLKTDSKIGETFGITRQAIHQLRKKYGIPSVLVKNKERNEKIIKAYKSGITGTSLANKFGLSISQTYRIINMSKVSTTKPKKAEVKKVVKKKVVKRKTAVKKVAKTKVVKKKAAKKKVAKKKAAVKKVVKKKAAQKKAAGKRVVKKKAASRKIVKRKGKNVPKAKSRKRK